MAARGLGWRITGAVIVLGLAGCATTLPTADLLIENVTVYTGTAAPPVVTNLAVRDGVFVAVDRTPVTAAQTIDGTGLYAMPGLWDVHAHIRSTPDGGLDVREFLDHGVTSIRDLGGYGPRIRAVQNAIAAGKPGPSIYPTFEMLNGEAFAGFQWAVTTRAEVTAALDKHVAAGATQIKVHRAVAPHILPIIIEQAHARGLYVVGHVPLGTHPLAACEMGIDGIEHIASFIETYMSVTASATVDDAFAYMLTDESDALYTCLHERGVEVTPTLVVYPSIAARRSGGGPLPEEFVRFIDNTRKVARRLHEAGITLLAGTDTSDLTESFTLRPGAPLLDELEMLQASGIAPGAVIAMATRNAARTLGVEQRGGTLEAGKTADFLLLSADPGLDIGNVRKLVAVYRHGQPHARLQP